MHCNNSLGLNVQKMYSMIYLIGFEAIKKNPNFCYVFLVNLLCMQNCIYGLYFSDVPAHKYVGCFRDEPGRDLSYHMIDTHEMSVAYCVTKCWAKVCHDLNPSR